MSFVFAILKLRWRVAFAAMLVALFGVATTIDDEAPPQTLRIGDTSFKVEVEKFPDSYVGMTYFEQKVIRIDPSSTSTLRRKVYLHELMHVAWHKGKLPINNEQTYTEDEAIEALVPGLLQILEQNPDTVGYLQNSKASTAKTVAQK